MFDGMVRGFMGLFGCMAIIVLILVLVIVGILIHWPTWYVVTAVVVTCVVSNLIRAWVDS